MNCCVVVGLGCCLYKFVNSAVYESCTVRISGIVTAVIVPMLLDMLVYVLATQMLHDSLERFKVPFIVKSAAKGVHIEANNSYWLSHLILC